MERRGVEKGRREGREESEQWGRAVKWKEQKEGMKGVDRWRLNAERVCFLMTMYKSTWVSTSLMTISTSWSTLVANWHSD